MLLQFASCTTMTMKRKSYLTSCSWKVSVNEKRSNKTVEQINSLRLEQSKQCLTFRDAELS